DRVQHHLAQRTAQNAELPPARPLALPPLNPALEADRVVYSHVELSLNRAKHTAELTIHAPKEPQPTTLNGALEAGASWWPLLAFRELDDALLRLRFDAEDVNVVALRTRGDAKAVIAQDELVLANATHPFVREALLLQGR